MGRQLCLGSGMNRDSPSSALPSPDSRGGLHGHTHSGSAALAPWGCAPPQADPRHGAWGLLSLGRFWEPVGTLDKADCPSEQRPAQALAASPFNAPLASESLGPREVLAGLMERLPTETFWCHPSPAPLTTKRLGPNQGAALKHTCVAPQAS